MGVKVALAYTCTYPRQTVQVKCQYADDLSLVFLFILYYLSYGISRLGVIYRHAIKSIEHKRLTDLVTLRNCVHFNVA